MASTFFCPFNKNNNVQVHPCAGKPVGEPTEHYVRAAQDVMVRNLERYQAAGNELRGRTVTMDRAYTSYDVVNR